MWPVADVVTVVTEWAREPFVTNVAYSVAESLSDGL